MKDKIKFLICIILTIFFLNFLSNLKLIFIYSKLSLISYNDDIIMNNLIYNLVNNVVFGILIGSAVYMVFISQSSSKKKILNYLCNLFVASILMTIYIVVYENFGEKYTFLKDIMQVLYYIIILGIPYIAIIAVTKLINYIYQRIIIKKLNAELNKVDIKNLDKKILLTTIVSLSVIAVIVVISLIVCNSATIS